MSAVSFNGSDSPNVLPNQQHQHHLRSKRQHIYKIIYMHLYMYICLYMCDDENDTGNRREELGLFCYY